MKFMLYITNTDKPGYIGALGSLLGDLGINIATFALGREGKSGEAIALLGVDEAVAPDDLGEIATLPQIRAGEGAPFLNPGGAARHGGPTGCPATTPSVNPSSPAPDF